MNISKLREWNENGFLQAAIDGNLQVKIKGNWEDIENNWFDIDLRYGYRIKPKFEIGDLVKTNGTVGKICFYDGSKYLIEDLIKENHTIITHDLDFVKVKQVLKPHTLETAVKDCAENGFKLENNNMITGLGMSIFYVNAGAEKYSGVYLNFPNGKPFCQVEYEECT